MDVGQDHAAADLPLVIGIVSSLADRVRLTEMLDGFGPLVLVSTVGEVRALLDSGAGADGSPGSPDRLAPAPDHARIRQLAGVQVDSDLLLATCGERSVSLTPLEHDLLVCLGAEPRHTWTHAALHEAVWNSNHNGGGRADIHSVVKRLRRKLAGLRAPVTIDAVRGVGFRLGGAAESVGWL